ncbi:ribosome maturation protein, partial [Morchella snyderi]
MPRGNTQQTKVVYKGKNDDFIVFIDSIADLEKWKKDPSVPLAQVLNGWKVFCTHKQGAQGIMDEASKANLSDEFGTSVEEEVVKRILQGGSPQVGVSSERQGDTNISKG